MSDIVLDLAQGQARRTDRPLTMTHRAFDPLGFFRRAPGQGCAGHRLAAEGERRTAADLRDRNVTVR